MIWRCLCPHCSCVHYGKTIDSTIIHNSHNPGCAYYERGIETSFDAKECKGVQRLIGWLRCR